MKRQLGLLTFCFLFMSALSRGQNNCPQGFAYGGTLYGTGSEMEGFDKRVVLKLPAGATLDQSFQQAKIRAGSAKGKANLQTLEVPKGILIIPHGPNNSSKSWSVSEPKIAEIKEQDDNGITSTRYEFGMHLMCSVASSPFGQGENCYVEAEVCYKAK